MIIPSVVYSCRLIFSLSIWTLGVSNKLEGPYPKQAVSGEVVHPPLQVHLLQPPGYQNPPMEAGRGALRVQFQPLFVLTRGRHVAHGEGSVSEN